MPRAALSTEEIATFRKRAIAAATKLFAEHGYEAVTMRAVADELGTSAMAPYRYFENKAEIFALVRAEATRALNDLQAAALHGPGSIVERLVRARDAYVRFALQHPDQYRIIFEQRSEPDDAYPELRAENQRSLELMEDIGKLVSEAGLPVRDPVTLAHLLWAQVHGLISLHHADKLKLGRTLEQVLELSAAALLGGIAINPSTPETDTSKASARPRRKAAKRAGKRIRRSK